MTTVKRSVAGICQNGFGAYTGIHRKRIGASLK
ncbi:hypothetical protein M2323_003048 [Rhodoblastus acidophilus]|nr:hypothetical protein [Rhodoblastus acidophilus]